MNKAKAWIMVSRYYVAGKILVSPVMKAGTTDKDGSEKLEHCTQYIDAFETKKEALAFRREQLVELKDLSA